LVLYGAAYAAFVHGTLHMSSPGGQVVLGLSLFGRAPQFLLGVLAAWIYRQYGEHIRARCRQMRWLRWGGADVALAATLVGLGFLLRKVVYIGFWRAETDWQVWHVLEGGFWSAVLMLVLLTPLCSKRLFSNPALRLLGVLSYSIYLLHNGVLYGLLRVLTPVMPGPIHGLSVQTFVFAGLAGVCSCGLAALTYRAIERPFLIRKARLDR
jgi:peptidoglycan/LPS O-acetylase OafA/YrhL